MKRNNGYDKLKLSPFFSLIDHWKFLFVNDRKTTDNISGGPL